MTLEWRALAVGEIDHEKLWGAVFVAAVGVWVGAWQLGQLPLPRCVFKTVTGLPCLTCGCGRAVLALLHGDPLAALGWNPLVPVGVLAGLLYVQYAVLTVLTGSARVRVRMGPTDGHKVRALAMVLAAALWGWLLVDGR